MKRALIVAFILLPLAISAQEPVIEPRWTEHVLISSEVVVEYEPTPSQYGLLPPRDSEWSWFSETIDVSQASEILVRGTVTDGRVLCETRFLWRDPDTSDIQGTQFSWSSGQDVFLIRMRQNTHIHGPFMFVRCRSSLATPSTFDSLRVMLRSE